MILTNAAKVSITNLSKSASKAAPNSSSLGILIVFNGTARFFYMTLLSDHSIHRYTAHQRNAITRSYLLLATIDVIYQEERSVCLTFNTRTILQLSRELEQINCSFAT